MKKLLLATLLGSFLLAGASAQASDYVVAVECWSDANCNSIYLSSICGDNSVVGISCTQVKTPTSTTSCSPGTCSYAMWYSQNLSVGAFCKDVNGYDALVTCHSTTW